MQLILKSSAIGVADFGLEIKVQSVAYCWHCEVLLYRPTFQWILLLTDSQSLKLGSFGQGLNDNFAFHLVLIIKDG